MCASKIPGWIWPPLPRRRGWGAGKWGREKERPSAPSARVSPACRAGVDFAQAPPRPGDGREGPTRPEGPSVTFPGRPAQRGQCQVFIKVCFLVCHGLESKQYTYSAIKEKLTWRHPGVLFATPLGVNKMRGEMGSV